eukprot:scaffold94054_cov23-Tisochrysis_lutea.AAC.3
MAGAPDTLPCSPMRHDLRAKAISCGAFATAAAATAAATASRSAPRVRRDERSAADVSEALVGVVGLEPRDLVGVADRARGGGRPPASTGKFTADALPASRAAATASAFAASAAARSAACCAAVSGTRRHSD